MLSVHLCSENKHFSGVTVASETSGRTRRDTGLVPYSFSCVVVCTH